METQISRQGSYEIAQQGSYIPDLEEYISYWINCFMFDRKSQNMSDGTLFYYRTKLRSFLTYCDSQQITKMNQLTADELRRFLAFLEDTGHNAGGRHALYRAIKTFLLWYENEAEPDGWKNPIKKVKPPKVPVEPLDPIPVEDVKAMEETCGKDYMGCRDKAILLCLLDTGAPRNRILEYQSQRCGHGHWGGAHSPGQRAKATNSVPGRKI